ncbi:MAG: carbohydrate binding domain-containing protein, partial [Lachnospiraceae bacterium]|nr:carbohydrate binding domain-containing protein [Lachnospiraceae bacterium]
FADSSISDKVSHIIDNQQEGNDDSCEITIKDTGDADWKIQLKQDNVKLEKGKWYTFSFDAKSNIERAIKYAFQRDGSDHKNDDGSEDWRSYSGDGNDTVDLTSTFKTYKKTFQMTEDTDPETILSISMGAVNGKQITKEHKITIDNISLVEATDPSSLVKVEK